MDIKKLNLLSNIIKYGFVAVGVLSCLFLFTGPNANETKKVIEDFRDGGAMSFATMFTIIVIIACVALVLLFFVTQLISNPKKTIMSIIGIAVALVVYLLFTMIGTSDTNESLQLRDPVAQSTINTTSAGLLTVLLALGATFLAAILGPIMGRLKK